jgi:hypothetical protein
MNTVTVDQIENAVSFLKKKDEQELNSRSLYVGMTESLLTKLNFGKQYPIGTILSDLRQLTVLLLKLFAFRDSGWLKSGEKYGGSSWWRAAIYESMYFLRKSGYYINGIRRSFHDVPSSPYIYYPLHYRPESSVLTLGNGMDDESAILFICQRLPFGMKLAVKENPSMIGDRRASFYRKISAIDGVVLIDPCVPTSKLAENSLGVISISGTALLEAGLKDIPAHAIGNPEFKEFLTSYGLDSIENFLVDCSMRKARSCKADLTRYLSFILESKINCFLGWDTVSNKQKLDHVATMISAELSKIIKL